MAKCPGGKVSGGGVSGGEMSGGEMSGDRMRTRTKMLTQKKKDKAEKPSDENINS